jgi:hypothetical protein
MSMLIWGCIEEQRVGVGVHVLYCRRSSNTFPCLPLSLACFQLAFVLVIIILIVVAHLYTTTSLCDHLLSLREHTQYAIRKNTNEPVPSFN